MSVAGAQSAFVAKQVDHDNFTVQIRSAHFGQDRPDEFVTRKEALKPPRYPDEAARTGVGGTVYVVAKVGRDGRIEDAIAERSTRVSSIAGAR